MKYVKNSLFFVPVILFLFVSVTFYFALKYNLVDELPSNLVNKVAPTLALSQLGQKVMPTDKDLLSPQIKFVNFWASWCAPCRVEHPILEKIAKLNHTVIGINYKDEPEKALEFLENLGDPYSKIGADLSGRNGLEWGLYGVPETFIVGADGKIIMRHAGPITSSIFKNKFKPLLQKISNN